MLKLYVILFFCVSLENIVDSYLAYGHISRSQRLNTDFHCVETEKVDVFNFQAPLEEIARRRNFAIISHPDAGKTTLTEKLLLYGGAIQDAGAVKTRGEQRRATSDYQDIEKQRGISVTSTVLTFDYQAHPTEDAAIKINLLDTPGHGDFGEDTYRTLSAADNCVMLIDAAKGIEDRTRDLFQVARMRDIPMFCFVNKMDRPSMDPWEIIDQLESEFSLQMVPINWPIGSGPDFQGVFDRATRVVHLFERGDRRKKVKTNEVRIDDPDLKEIINNNELFDKLMEDIEMLDEIMPQAEVTEIQQAQQSPLFFGSAMSNFGVELFLNNFIDMAKRPAGRKATIIDPSTPKQEDCRIVDEHSNEFSGFIFKTVANLDPKHRDRMAFLRICSGTFRKGMKVGHSRMSRKINLASAQNLFAQDRESVEEAFPGDVIGIHNPGHFAIGDTLFTGATKVEYEGIPMFSPEKFAYIINPNPSNYKKFQKGISELLDEGAIQMLRDRQDDGNLNPILAAVGQLQFEVVEYRLKNEYGCDCKWEPLTFSMARWVNGGWEAVEKAADKLLGVSIVQDRWNRPVALFRNEWKMQSLINDPDLALELVPYAMPPKLYSK